MARLARGTSKRSDGRLVRRFTVNTKRYYVYGHSTKELDEKEQEKRKAIEAGLRVTGKNVTVDRYFSDWIEAKVGSVGEATIRADRSMYRTITGTQIDKAGTTFGSLKLKDVEPQDVRELQQALLEGHNTRTVNDMISLVRGMFRTACDCDRIIPYNPCASIRKLKRTEPQARDTKHRALTRQETATFLKAAYEAESYFYYLYVFLLNTGCRIGEAGALQLCDIGKNSVHIARTLTRTADGGYTVGEGTKTAAGDRLVPINADAQQAIEHQKGFNRLVFGSNCSMTDSLFKSPTGKYLRSNKVNEDIARICKTAGMECFTVHALRDTFCTRCVESGMPAKTLQTIMGHTDITMTFGLYAHCEEHTAVEQLKAVNFT